MATSESRKREESPFPPLPAAAEAASLLRSRAADVVELCNLPGSAPAKFLADLLPHLQGPLLAIVPEPEDADGLAADLRVFGSSGAVYPGWDILPSETDQPDIDLAKDQIGALRQLASGGGIVCISAPALLQPALPADFLGGARLSVKAGQELPPETLLARLADAGFETVDEVDLPGQSARRGGILDVFPFFADRPVRIEFFGDEIETVRFFDPGTQRSDAPVAYEVTLVDVNRDSFRQAYDRAERVKLLSYLPDNATVLLLAPQKLRHAAELYHSGFAPGSPLFVFEQAIAGIERFRTLVVPDALGDDWRNELPVLARAACSVDCGCKGMERVSGGLETAFSELRALDAAGERLTVFCTNTAERARFEELLQEEGGGLAARLELRLGTLSKGFHAQPLRRAFTSDQDILGRVTLRRPAKKRNAGAPLADFTDLRPGDYVVHLAHGIAHFDGIQTIDNGGTQADYLCLRFAEDARIYVPLSHIELVQRYIGGSEGRPTLSKLGSGTWQRRKQAAAAAAKDIAADLLRLQAARSALPGIAFPPDDEMVREFEAAFPYEETPDQLSAVADIRKDQLQASPMDRLLCGDVGFGKTEVAMRAAFKVVTSGKQVAVLVPTTILAEQHCRSFRERMADYPVTVACLSRFRTPEETRTIIDRTETGGVDILIGTHRILSKDVKFRDLGLVVVDEEQRFGVEQKERLKEMRVSVDVLSMSATPIPRTLNMALLGLRDISNLTTPPTERQSIRTEVVGYNEELIRRAILRELARGGQAFFLHNRVHNIHHVAGELATLVPEARFGVAHGQMEEKELYQAMSRFLARKLDVLVCTTIIESGVDMPSVNTLFVNNAEHFGLGALHQLRGRVGRYKHKAYAYFLIPAKRPVSPIAQKRLLALKEYSELGAGFRLAMRDLEIRGAGNILGAEQSGHINLIGFELYCRLLEKSVAQLKGEDVSELEPVELDLGTVAFIPTEYVPADAQRIDIYRKLSAAADEEALTSLAALLRDKYGAIPDAVQALFADQRLRARAQTAGINYVGRIDNALSVGFAEGKGGVGMRKLKLLRRKVTPLDRGRWRVAVGEHETPLIAAQKIIDKLQLSDDELREITDERKRLLKEAADQQLRAMSDDDAVTSAIELGDDGYDMGDDLQPPRPAKRGRPGKDSAANAPARSATDETEDGPAPESFLPQPKARPTTGRGYVQQGANWATAGGDPDDDDVARSGEDRKPDNYATGRASASIYNVGAPRASQSPAPSHADTADTGTHAHAGKREQATTSSKSAPAKGGKPARTVPEPSRPGARQVAKIQPKPAARKAGANPYAAQSGGSGRKYDLSNDPRYRQTAGALAGAYLARLEAEEAQLAQPKREPEEPGAKILGLVPDERLGIVGAVVEEDAFDLRRFGSVTIVFKKQKFYLRYTGATHQSGGRVTLNLRAESGEEVAAVCAAHLAAGPGRVLPGVIE